MSSRNPRHCPPLLTIAVVTPSTDFAARLARSPPQCPRPARNLRPPASSAIVSSPTRPAARSRSWTSAASASVPISRWIRRPPKWSPCQACPRLCARRENATVYEIDAVSLAVSRRVRLGNEAVSMRLSRTGDSLWVPAARPRCPGGIAVRLVPSGAADPFPSPPDGLDLSRETNDACIVTRADRTLAIVSLDQAA